VSSGLVASNIGLVAPNIGLVANAVGLVASCYVDLCMLVNQSINQSINQPIDWLLGLCVCVCVCLSPLILALQGPSRLISDTNSSGATRARKVMWRFC